MRDAGVGLILTTLVTEEKEKQQIILKIADSPIIFAEKFFWKTLVLNFTVVFLNHFEGMHQSTLWLCNKFSKFQEPKQVAEVSRRWDLAKCCQSFIKL